jgi:hypothetical protein
MVEDFFSNRAGVLATMHRKEEAIAPLMQQELGIRLIVPESFNTDQFGTFTREVKRPGDQHQAARLKAEQAMTFTGYSLGLASEGSFGPHPAFPYIASNREIVLLLDREHDLEIIGQDFTTETNYSHQRVESLEAAIAFAQTARFPDHGLVVMPDADSGAIAVKGITDAEQFREVVSDLLKRYGSAHIETDMRAMVNPTRMQAIARATEDLIRKLRQTCPQCGTPGFEVSDRKPGLPCGLCHFPTALTLAAIYQCKKCGFTQEQHYPEGVQEADPAQCMYCNP